jgi:twitching motility protein PilU
LDRIVNFFPENKRHQVLQDLSLNLVSIVSQRLAIREDKRGRALALEIMLNSAMISDLVAKGAVEEIKDVIKKSQSQGMQTFDQSLFELFENRVISYSEAIRNADSVNDLRIMIKISSERAKSSDLAAGTEHLRFI